MFFDKYHDKFSLISVDIYSEPRNNIYSSISLVYHVAQNFARKKNQCVLNAKKLVPATQKISNLQKLICANILCHMVFHSGSRLQSRLQDRGLLLFHSYDKGGK